jgi:hypothetical protein
MIESAQKLAEEAGMSHRMRFEVCEVGERQDIGKKFDVVYSERMVINLPDWESQARAILYMISLLKAGGRYLMCENSSVGLGNLNKLRMSAGLEAISPPWDDVYLVDDLVSSLVILEAKLVDVESFSTTCYFLSRVVNTWLAAREETRPAYDAALNQLALKLPPFGDCAQGKLWIFEKS